MWALFLHTCFFSFTSPYSFDDADVFAHAVNHCAHFNHFIEFWITISRSNGTWYKMQFLIEIHSTVNFHVEQISTDSTVVHIYCYSQQDALLFFIVKFPLFTSGCRYFFEKQLSSGKNIRLEIKYFKVYSQQRCMRLW